MKKKGIYHWMITVIILAVIFVIPLLHPSVRYRTAAKNDKICISVTGTGSQGIGYRQIIRGDDILAPVEDFDKNTGIMTRILGKKYRAVQQGRCDLYMYNTIGGGDIESLDIYHISANEKHKITYTVDSGEPLLRGFDFYYYPAAGDSIHINSTVISDDQMLSSITDDLLTVAGKHTECIEPDTSGFDHICIYHERSNNKFTENVYISNRTIYYNIGIYWTQFEPFEGQYTDILDIIEKYDTSAD